MHGVGTHMLIDLYGCDGEKLNDLLFIKNNLLKACEKADVHVLNTYFKTFKSNNVQDGITGIIAISESHLSIHTWPSLGLATLDIFTCGNTSFPEKAKDFLLEEFKPKDFSIKNVLRGGNVDGPDSYMEDRWQESGRVT